jgi:hypothetical protein
MMREDDGGGRVAMAAFEALLEKVMTFLMFKPGATDIDVAMFIGVEPHQARELLEVAESRGLIVSEPAPTNN